MQRVFHVDLDAFYVSVERALDPTLNGKPVVVGGDPDSRGVVACASYEARRYGLHAGMPLAQARRLCPGAVFVKGRYDRYQEISERFHAILADYTPFVQPASLDEAFLDMSGFESLYGPAADAAVAMRRRISQELGITASVGIAGCKAAAKVASDLRKPDGYLEVPLGKDAAFLAPMEIEKLSGIGARSAARLRSAGIATLGELAAAPPANIHRLFGAWGDVLQRRASGEDSRVSAPGDAKSISRETTFSRDTHDGDFVRATLRYLGERVGADLRRDGRRARRVYLKLRWADFTTVSRQATIERPTDEDETIYGMGLALLRKELAQEAGAGARAVRLIGVGVADLAAPDPQLPLWAEGGTGDIASAVMAACVEGASSHDEADGLRVKVGVSGPGDLPAFAHARRLDHAVDSIRSRYGTNAIQRGLTLSLHGDHPERQVKPPFAVPRLARERASGTV